MCHIVNSLPAHPVGTPAWLEENLNVAFNVINQADQVSKWDPETTMKIQNSVEQALEQILTEGEPISPRLQSMLALLSREGQQPVNELARSILEENSVSIHLPDEILFNILSRLENPSQVARVSWDWYRVSLDSRLARRQLESMVNAFSEIGLSAFLRPSHVIALEGRLCKNQVKALGKLLPRLRQLEGTLSFRVLGFNDAKGRAAFYKLLESNECPISGLDLSFIPLHQDKKHRVQLEKALKHNFSLESLSLAHTLVRDHFKDIAKSLKEFPNLRHLNLRGNALTEDELLEVAEAVQHMPQLTRLSIMLNTRSEQVLAAFTEALDQHCSVKFLALDLPDLPRDSQALKDFSSFLAGSPQLETLRLNTQWLKNDSLQVICQGIKKNPAIKVLRLSGPIVWGGHYPALEALEQSRPDLKITRDPP